MKLNIIIERTTEKNECMAIAKNIHESLVGYKDYILSNVVLNVNEEENQETITLYANKDDCYNFDKIKAIVKTAIDNI